ncbi:THAP domain-containing protein 11-like [Acropora millepora]|uniref:THAP domain-containing protein 11-like n=1 Tax=Acropora millepora TaxID=45264 RepID=UPI001CF31685|nr:THAP domain-containing protein 11-like [Acropora millepora]
MSKFHCCVPLCTNDSRYNSALSFHRFPSSLELRRQWIVKIRRDEGECFQITPNTRVCSEHFQVVDYLPDVDNLGRKRLKSGAIPTQFQWHRKPPRRELIRSFQQLDE